MQLTPITTSTEPAYPIYRPALPTWRKIAAVLTASAALCLPACGEDTTRLSGDTIIPEGVRLAGAESVVEPPKPVEKPPEIQNQVWPMPQARTSGNIAPVTPPSETRLGGRPRSPQMPQ